MQSIVNAQIELSGDGFVYGATGNATNEQGVRGVFAKRNNPITYTVNSSREYFTFIAEQTPDKLKHDISVLMELDQVRPVITSVTKAPDDSYIDLTFSKGVYGSSK